MWHSGTSCRLWCIAALIAVVSGCASNDVPRIDPTGEHIFASQPIAPQAPIGDYRPSTPATIPTNDVGVTIAPLDKVAPVGSEVILVAGVIGADGLLKAHRRLEWTIAPGSVGQFTNIAKSGCFDRLLGDNNPHQIVAAGYAVGSTLHNYEQLTHGSPNPADVVSVTSGQGWVALTSLVPGDSVVTVVAPEINGSNCRQKTATIHWVGAAVVAGPGGTTTLAPGPIPAGTSPSPTNPSPTSSPGPAAATPGPAASAAPGPATTTTPAAPSSPAAGVSPSQIDLQIDGQQQAMVGSEVQFTITIANRGMTALEKLALYDFFDPGLQHPNPQVKDRLKAPLPTIPANQKIQMPLRFKVLQAGQLCHTAEVRGPDGKIILAKRKACVTAVNPATPPSSPPGAGTGAPPPRDRYGEPPAAGPGPGMQPPSGPAMPPPAQSDLSVKVTGEAKRTVGELASFLIEIKNLGTKDFNNLRVEAALDPAYDIQTADASQGFWRENGRLIYVQPRLPGGKTLKLEIRCKCLQPAPKAIAHVSVTSAEGVRQDGETESEIIAAGAPPSATPPMAAPGAAESKLQMTMICTKNPAFVGKQFHCLVTVANSGSEEERNVVVDIEVPEGLVIVPVGTNGPTKNLLQKQTVHFDPLPSLPPGKTLTYRVLVQSKSVGKYTFKASLSSQKLSPPMLKEQSVDVTQ